MTALIIEDERRSRILLGKYLRRYCKGIEVIGESASIKDSISKIEFLKPNLIFLDVELKDGKGLDILEHFKDPNFVSILVTGYDFYAIKAIKKNALDYILKPIVITELTLAVEKAKKKFQELLLLNSLKANKSSKHHNKLIIQSTKHQVSVIDPEDIIFIEAQNQYTKWHFKDQTSMLVRQPLFSFLEILPDDFFQIHRSYIININEVSSVDKTRNGFVVLGSIKLPLAHSRRKDFFDSLVSKND